MDGHVVHTLLALFDHGVPIDLPGQLLGLAADFFQRLIDRYGPDRDRRVPNDPLPGRVDVTPGGQIHDGVGTPAGRPHHLVDLLLDGRGHRRIPDVRIDFHQECPADRHRLGLRMIDVRR